MKLDFRINKLDFLVSLYIFCIAVSELMGGKIFPILHIGTFQLNASVAIFVIPIIFSINDIMVEVYGVERARSLVRSGLLIIFFILLFSLFATHLPAAKRFLKMEPAYDAIFSFSARISAASLISFIVSELLDVALFAALKKRMGKKGLWFRNNASNFLSQFIDTTLFISLAFYSFSLGPQANIQFLTSLIIPYWLLKCFMSVVETPLVYVGIWWMKRKDEKE